MSTNDIRLARGSAAHWPAVRELLALVELPQQGAREHIDSFLLAHRGSKLVGCVGAEVYGDVALLRSVAVHPRIQHRGLGHSLVERALDEARERGIRTVYLLTATAAEFFARRGFRHVARAEAPPALRASAEFQGVCPDSAAFMTLELAALPRAADRVDLDLPETGACGVPADRSPDARGATSNAGCGAPPADVPTSTGTPREGCRG